MENSDVHHEYLNYSEDASQYPPSYGADSASPTEEDDSVKLFIGQVILTSHNEVELKHCRFLSTWMKMHSSLSSRSLDRFLN
jgi:hypothetical protein